jgi:hypothetical protein
MPNFLHTRRSTMDYGHMKLKTFLALHYQKRQWRDLDSLFHKTPFLPNLKQTADPRRDYPPITYYWTVNLILDHSYHVRKSRSSKIADTKVSGFERF